MTQPEITLFNCEQITGTPAQEYYEQYFPKNMLIYKSVQSYLADNPEDSTTKAFDVVSKLANTTKANISGTYYAAIKKLNKQATKKDAPVQGAVREPMIELAPLPVINLLELMIKQIISVGKSVEALDRHYPEEIQQWAEVYKIFEAEVNEFETSLLAASKMGILENPVVVWCRQQVELAIEKTK